MARVVDERTALVRDGARRSSTRTCAVTLALGAMVLVLVTARAATPARVGAVMRARVDVDVEGRCPAARVVAAGCLNDDMVTCAPHANETLANGRASDVAALGGCSIADPAPKHCLVPDGTPVMKSCEFDYGCSVYAPATCPAGSLVAGASACETKKVCFCPKCNLSGCKWNGCCKNIPIKFTANCRKYRLVGTSDRCKTCMVGYKLSSDKRSCTKYDLGTAVSSISVQTAHQLSAQAVSGVSSTAINAWQHSGIENAYDAASGWSEDAVETVRESAVEAVEAMEDVIKLITQLLSQLECLEGLAHLKKFARALRSQGTGIFDLVEDVLKGQENGESRTKYFNEMSGVACNMVWAKVFPHATLAVEMIKAFGRRLRASCPALKSGDLPAFTYGVVLGGDLSGGVYTAEAATEIGVGADLEGTRFCYVAACVGGGYTIPPKTGAEASVSASIAVSGYKDIGTVAGTAGYFALDLGADLPIIPVGIDLGMSYIHGVGNPDQIYGISFAGQVSSASSDVNPAPWPSAGVTAGVCHTGICVRTDGEPCTSGQKFTPFGVASSSSSSSSSLGDEPKHTTANLKPRARFERGRLGFGKAVKKMFSPPAAPPPPPQYDASALFTEPTAAEIKAAGAAVDAPLPDDQKTQAMIYRDNPSAYVPPSRVTGGKFLAHAGCSTDFKDAKLLCMETNNCIGFGQYQQPDKTVNIFGNSVTVPGSTCWDLLQPSTSATDSKYKLAQIRNFVIPDYGFAYLRTWGRSTSDDAEDREAVRRACWRDFACVGYGQKSNRDWDLLKYGDTKTNIAYTKGIWRKYVSPVPGYTLVNAANIDLQSVDAMEEALDGKCQTDWKCLGFDFIFKFSGLKLTRRAKLLYPGGKAPSDDWRFKYQHFYGVADG